ncbi:MAG: flagellar basal body protein [Deltaproteobacteria bacterium]|nr:flagellar basal body protein [Deltaproteobacteria bacterium]
MSLAINVAMTALRALDKKMEVTANNTANVNTDGFKASRVETQEAYPEGVKVTISQTETPGTPLPVTEGSETAESSNVSLEEQMLELVTTPQMYNANLEVVKSEDEMLGSLLDIRG